jgi:uncharacterized protein DUF4184
MFAAIDTGHFDSWNSLNIAEYPGRGRTTSAQLLRRAATDAAGAGPSVAVMPLTLPTHPTAVVPLKLWRPRWFDGVALVVGTTAPDLSYATYGLGAAMRTHNLLSLLWWSLPVTVVAAVLIRWAAPPIAAHLPGAGSLRLRDYGVLGAVRHRWYVTASSALLGAFSHLAWDAVTHPGYVVALQREVWPGTPWWGLFSDASNLVGFAAGALLLVRIGRGRLLRRWHGAPPPARRRPVVFWSAVVVVFAGGLALIIGYPVDWVTGQAIRVLVIAGLALCGGAAAARLTSNTSGRAVATGG